MKPQMSQREMDQEALDLLDQIIKSGRSEPTTLGELRSRFEELGGTNEFVFGSLVEQFQARAWLRSASFSIPEGSKVLEKVTQRRNVRTLRSVAGVALAIAAGLAIVFFLVVPSSTPEELQFRETMHALHTLPDSDFTPVSAITLGDHTFVDGTDKEIVGHHQTETRDVFRLRRDDNEPVTLIADWNVRDFDPSNGGTLRRIGEGLPCLCLPVDQGHLIYWNEGRWTMAIVGPRSDGYVDLLELANSFNRFPQPGQTELVFHTGDGQTLCPLS